MAMKLKIEIDIGRLKGSPGDVLTVLADRMGDVDRLMSRETFTGVSGYVYGEMGVPQAGHVGVVGTFEFVND
jgi:hypothetical protein